MRRMIVLAAVLLAGCQTTKPLEGADISYDLPRTDGKATATLTLKGCAPVLVDAEIAVTPQSGGQKKVVTIRGVDLASARIKRSLTISLNDKGVIKAVNTNNADRSPQIVGNYLNAGLKLATLFAASKAMEPLTCSKTAEAALQRSKFLRNQIDALRLQLAAGAASGAVSDAQRRGMKDLVLLTTELGALDPLLKVDATVDLPLNRDELEGNAPLLDDSGQAVVDNGVAQKKPPPTQAAPYAANFEVDPFVKWFSPRPTAKAIKDNFALAYWTEIPAAPTAVALKAKPAGKGWLRECGFSIPVPSPARIVVHVESKGVAYATAVDAKKSLPAAQLADPKALCLDAGFGEARSVALTLDEYGQTTDYAWTSEATQEGVSGIASGAADSAVGFAKAAFPTDLAEKKAEIEKLQTEQTLSDLRACKAIKAAGGTCPSK